MGCGSSKATVAVDGETAAPVAKAPAKTTTSSEKAADVPTKSGAVQETVVVEADSTAQTHDQSAAAWTKGKVGEMNAAAKLTYMNTFVLPYSVKDVWALVSDWNVEYLVAYSSKVSVITGTEKDHPSLLNRHVKLPSGVFYEVLLHLNNETHSVDYVTVDGPVLFQRHFISFSLTITPAEDGSGDQHCKMSWSSYAWPKSAENAEKAQKMLEQGVINAIQVINHTLKTRNAA